MNVASVTDPRCPPGTAADPAAGAVTGTGPGAERDNAFVAMPAAAPAPVQAPVHAPVPGTAPGTAPDVSPATAPAIAPHPMPGTAPETFSAALPPTAPDLAPDLALDSAPDLAPDLALDPVPESSTTPRAQGRPRSAAADAAILLATRELLAEQGWDRLSLGEVAARAGVAKSTLYRRWPGKADLVVDAMAEIFDTLQPVDAGSVRADAAAVITDLVALLTRPETQAAFLALAAESARDPRLRDVVREKIIDRQRHLVLSGAARARARAQTHAASPQIHDPGLVFDVITGTIVHRLLIAGEPVDEDYLTRFLDFLLAALNPQEETDPPTAGKPQL